MQVLTGLTPDEFRDLVPSFSAAGETHTELNWRGQERQRAKGGGPQAGLASTEEKLFFLLFYLRHYPVQEVMGALFGFDQAQANRWILRLTPLLQQALEDQQVLPQRSVVSLELLLEQSGALNLLLDGTDRPVRRPQDPEKQRQCFSGRKKRHTVKNVVLTCRRAVQFLSPTAPGSQSDKRLAEPLEQVEIPRRSVVLSDLGFQGLNLTNKSLIHPAKKPKGQELAPIFRRFNRVIAATRVSVEHVISGVKRCRIVSDVLRHIKEGFNDLVMEVACGLHNFREVHRSELTPVLLPIQMN